MSKKQRLASFGVMAMIAMMCLAWGCAVPLPIGTDYIKDKALDGVAKHQVKNAVTKACNAKGIHDQHTINLLTKQVMARLASLSPEQRAGAATFISVFVTEVVTKHQQQQGVQAAKPSTEPKKLETAKLPPEPKYTPPFSKPGEVARDGTFIADANGIVRDTATGLEWVAGPDRDTNWDEAKSWVEIILTVDGGGWRMPTIDELKTLWKKGAGTCNITPLLKTTVCWVWSRQGKKRYASVLWFPGLVQKRLPMGGELRAFAVRSRR